MGSAAAAGVAEEAAEAAEDLAEAHSAAVVRAEAGNLVELLA